MGLRISYRNDPLWRYAMADARKLYEAYQVKPTLTNVFSAVSGATIPRDDRADIMRIFFDYSKTRAIPGAASVLMRVVKRRNWAKKTKSDKRK